MAKVWILQQDDTNNNTKNPPKFPQISGYNPKFPQISGYNPKFPQVQDISGGLIRND